MRINYPTRSSFLEGCEEVICLERQSLLQGKTICVEFSSQGYNGTIRVSIEKESPSDFWADWEYSDTTRFPVRIRAAALALFQQGCFGEYIISHNTGTLTIQRIKS